MTMLIALDGDEALGEIDRERADAIARRVARAARTKAIAAWTPMFMVDKDLYADVAYKLTYEVTFVKAIAKQKGKLYGFNPL